MSKIGEGRIATGKSSRLLATFMTGTALAAFATPNIAMAQEAQDAQISDGEDQIIVTGIRQTIQNSIEEKRNATEVFDALSADEIGDLPALSIGEALATHKFGRALWVGASDCELKVGTRKSAWKAFVFQHGTPPVGRASVCRVR